MRNQWVAWRQGSLGVWSIAHIRISDVMAACGEYIPETAVRAARAMTKCSKCQEATKSVSANSNHLQAQSAQYPEHAKLKRVQDQSQVIGDFIEWLNRNNYSIAIPHRHSPECRDQSAMLESFGCGYSAGELQEIYETTEQLLAKYFQVDLAALEREKRDMLQALRKGGAQ